jgi:predicted HD phosphohydrolase
MEQSAACARADNAPDSLVIAALLHDIGHFIGAHPIEALENGIDNVHETAGADYLPQSPSPSGCMSPPNVIFARPMTDISAVCRTPP